MKINSNYKVQIYLYNDESQRWKKNKVDNKDFTNIKYPTHPEDGQSNFHPKSASRSQTQFPGSIFLSFFFSCFIQTQTIYMFFSHLEERCSLVNSTWVTSISRCRKHLMPVWTWFDIFLRQPEHIQVYRRRSAFEGEGVDRRRPQSMFEPRSTRAGRFNFGEAEVQSFL